MTAQSERAGLSLALLLMATAREAGGDTLTADALRRIAATIDRVEDGELMKLAAVNETSDGLLSKLIALHLEQVGRALPLYEDATAFLAPISATVDQILARARRGMH